jgi:FkbM family methyltransferase
MAFISYAQNFEDVMLWRALKDVEPGFYIDVGAADATIDSVTRAFYERGWRGINIEPEPELFRKLAAARPEDINLDIAVGGKSGEAPFFAVVGEGLSTLVPNVADAARNRGFRIEELRVCTRTLAEICERHAKTPIHFLKIDVEGAEWDVLAGADFTAYRPWIVIVEATFPMTQIDTYGEWEPLLFSAGYRFVWFDGLNRFYLAEEQYGALGPHFAHPVNFFDEFVRFDPASEDRIASLTRQSRDYAEQLAAAHRQTQELAGKIQEAAATLQGKIGELQGKEAQLQETDAALRERAAELARTQGALNAVLGSRSWRMTAPLRWVARFLRR